MAGLTSTPGAPSTSLQRLYHVEKVGDQCRIALFIKFSSYVHGAAFPAF
jgi:hypothetical protein